MVIRKPQQKPIRIYSLCRRIKEITFTMDLFGREFLFIDSEASTTRKLCQKPANTSIDTIYIQYSIQYKSFVSAMYYSIREVSIYVLLIGLVSCEAIGRVMRVLYTPIVYYIYL